MLGGLVLATAGGQREELLERVWNENLDPSQRVQRDARPAPTQARLPPLIETVVGTG